MAGAAGGGTVLAVDVITRAALAEAAKAMAERELATIRVASITRFIDDMATAKLGWGGGGDILCSNCAPCLPPTHPSLR